MKKFEKNTKRGGIIGTLIMIIAIIILLAYFKNDIQNFLNSAAVKNALLTAIGWIQTALMWIVGKLGWTSSQIK